MVSFSISRRWLVLYIIMLDRCVPVNKIFDGCFVLFVIQCHLLTILLIISLSPIAAGFFSSAKIQTFYNRRMY